MKLLIDENLPPVLADMLTKYVEAEGAGHIIKSALEMNLAGKTDKEIAEILSPNGGWSMLTKDSTILRKIDEKEAFRKAKVTLFVLHKGWKGIGFHDTVWRIIRNWPKFVEVFTNKPPGSVFCIGFNSEFKFEVNE